MKSPAAMQGVHFARYCGVLLTAFALTLGPATLRAEDMPGPRERLERAVSVVVVLLEDKSLDPEARWQSIAAIVFDRFDFQTMARSVMAGAWNEVGIEQRLDFVEYFARYVVKVYRARIEGRSAERVEYVAERIEGDRASVETVIVAGEVEIPVTYRLARRADDWRVYDVLVEGVSLVASYRDRFADALGRGDVGTVIEQLKAGERRR